MTTVRLTRFTKRDHEGLLWEGEGVDVDTGEVVVFGGIRDWAEPIAARFHAEGEFEVTIEPQGLVLGRRDP
jgi:hypothetical protein